MSSAQGVLEGLRHGPLPTQHGQRRVSVGHGNGPPSSKRMLLDATDPAGEEPVPLPQHSDYNVTGKYI